MRRCPSCSKSYSDNTQFCPEDGAALGPTASESGDVRLGTTIDRYRLEAKLGTGGMGVVYRAEHIHLRRPVALKLLHAHLAEDSEVVERFFREARAAGDLASEHIVEVSDFGTFEDGAFLVMEYLPGKSLDTVLQGKRMDRRRTVHIAMQIASALEAAHHKGVVHRDLKPANVILVQQDGDPDFVKVLDFGIAKLVQGETKQLTKTGIVMGTPAYMAPEQASGEKVDARTDIYALGVMLYEMLGGAPPFTGENPTQVLVAHVTRPPEPLRTRCPDIPEGLEQLVLGCLAKIPDQRPASMAALQQALAPWIAEDPVTATKAGVGSGLMAPAAIPAAVVPAAAIPAAVVAPAMVAPAVVAPATPPISAMAPTMAAPATPLGVAQAGAVDPAMLATGPATPAGLAPPTQIAVATPAPGTLSAAAAPPIPPTAVPGAGPMMPLQDSIPHTAVPLTPMAGASAQPTSSGNLTRVLIVLGLLVGIGAGVAATLFLTRDPKATKPTEVASSSLPGVSPSSPGGSSAEYDDDEDDDDQPSNKNTSGDKADHKASGDKADHKASDDKADHKASDDKADHKTKSTKPPAVSAAPGPKKRRPSAAPRPRASSKKRPALAAPPTVETPPPAVDQPSPAPPPVRKPPPRVAPVPRARPAKVRRSISTVKQRYRAGQISRFQYKQQVDHLKFLRKKQLQGEVQRYKVRREVLKNRYRRGLISRPQIKMLERALKQRHKMRLRQIKEAYR